jgi:hypothetical protein
MQQNHIYSIKPTYLYVKQHNITGLKYFGKTSKNPYAYQGSGKYWISHIKQHGRKYVKTLWVSEVFTDKVNLVVAALKFSFENDIVNSMEWANLKIENGLDGGDSGIYPFWAIGRKDSPEIKEKRASKIRGTNNGMYGKCGDLNPFYGKSHSLEAREKMRQSAYDRSHSPETIEKIRQSMSKPITINGIRYESIRKAMKILKRSHLWCKSHCS